MSDYNTAGEVWKDVKGYEGLYLVSNHGRAKRKGRTTIRTDGVELFYKERMMSTPLNNDGYPIVHLTKDKKGNTERVHRLVAEAFVDNPNGYSEVNHIDEDKANNHPSNLEWCTREHNMNHGTLWERVNSHPAQIKAFERSKKAIVGIEVNTGSEIRFESIAEAHRNGFKRRNIWSVLNGDDRSHKNHVWLYETDYSEKKKQEALKPFKKRVCQVDEAGNILNEYKDTVEAAKAVGVHHSNISRACNVGRKSAGFHWKIIK